VLIAAAFRRDRLIDEGSPFAAAFFVLEPRRLQIGDHARDFSPLRSQSLHEIRFRPIVARPLGAPFRLLSKPFSFTRSSPRFAGQWPIFSFAARALRTTKSNAGAGDEIRKLEAGG